MEVQGPIMDGAEAAAPAAEEKAGEEEEDDLGYRLFPDRNKKPQSFLVRSLFTFHNKCQLMLRMTLDTSKRFPAGPGPALAQRRAPRVELGTPVRPVGTVWPWLAW